MLRKSRRGVPEPSKIYTEFLRRRLTILATFPHFRSCCTAKEWDTLSMGMLLTCITRSFSLPNSTKTCNQILFFRANWRYQFGVDAWPQSGRFLTCETRKREETYYSKPSAGPPCRTSDTMMDVSPLSTLGLSLPPDTAIPNPILESLETEWKYEEKKTALKFKALLL